MFFDACGEDTDSEDIPYFIDDLLYVPIYDNDYKYDVYDKQGKKTGTVDYNVAENYYNNHEIGDFTIFSKTHEDWYDDNDDYEIDKTFGLKDLSGKVILSADYDAINGKYEGSINIKNGVVFVEIHEFDEEYKGGPDGLAIRHYGYADLKGNDTFTAEQKKRWQQSKITAMQNMSNENSETYEYDGSMEYNTNEDLSWIQGNWRCTVDVFGEPKDYRVGIADQYISVFMDGEHYYTGPYKISGDMITCKDIYLLIDRDRKVIMADRSTTMQRF